MDGGGGGGGGGGGYQDYAAADNTWILLGRGDAGAGAGAERPREWLAQENVDARLQMMEKVAVHNRSTELRGPVVSDYEATPLSRLFFSRENMDIVQHAIRAGVYAKSGNQYIVAPQNAQQLKIIMRGVYLENARTVLHQERSGVMSVTAQIAFLNRIAAEHCVEVVFNEAVAYLKFLRDKSFLPQPLRLPHHNDRQHRDLPPPNML